MLKYTTTQGDMWDTISKRVYGTEKLMNVLIDANHIYRQVAVFGANIELNVPDVHIDTRPSFPPWRTNV